MSSNLLHTLIKVQRVILIFFNYACSCLVCSATSAISFRFNQFESRENCTCANHEVFFWLGTKIFPYVHFTYSNIFSEDPSGSFTQICDVTLPRLLKSQNPALALLHYYSFPFPQQLLDLPWPYTPGNC